MSYLNQLLLNFDLKQNYKDEDFYVSESNFYAFNLINKWPKWEKNFLNLCGEKFSGKTHLTNIFLKKFKGIKFQAHEFQDIDLKEIKIHENIVLDNLDQDVNERLIYSLFNIIDQDNKFLIVTSLTPVNEINFRLDGNRNFNS